MPVDLAVELSKHPNIVGMKDSGGDIAKIGQIIAETGNSPDNFCLLAGSASFLLPALNVGAVGGICALANALPEECLNLQDLFCKLNINQNVNLMWSREHYIFHKNQSLNY